MLGVFITLIAATGMAGLGHALLFRKSEEEDPALAWGLSGLIGLGFLGLGTLFVGLVPGSLSGWGIFVVALAVIAGLALAFRNRSSLGVAIPKGRDAAFLLPLALVVLFTLVATLAPSDMNDWDSLAYHLAVPKLWIAAGQIGYVPAIHHSNFPFTVDLLYVWGLRWGGESGAKAFELSYLLFGLLLLFGIARSRYGARAGWWSALAFATVPVVMWEAGSAYIDVAHGLYAGGGILFAALAFANPESRRYWIYSGLLLGFAAGSKYTGLQTIAAVGFTLVVAGFATRSVGPAVRRSVSIAALALLVSAPWYIKNVVTMGNPVYPFFAERLGGRDWDNRRAAIYRNEQQTFGVGRTDKSRDPSALGHAILGLAYQPGRYVNPGQEQGMGSPLGAIGFAMVAGLLLWPLAGRIGRFEAIALGTLAISLFMWFFLSQQSRYIVPLAVPVAVLLGGATVWKGLGTLVMAAIGLQAGYSLWLVQKQRVTSMLPVVLGKVTPEEYRAATVPYFSEASKGINERVKGGKVALYDEVFGYLLDVPYLWANPGHSTLIPYDQINTGQEYTQVLKGLGVTHVYISLSPIVKDRAFAQRWLASMSNGDPANGFSDSERAGLMSNWESKFHVLIADAVREGHLVPDQQFRSGVLFKVVN